MQCLIFQSIANIHEDLKDIQKRLNITIEDLESLKLYYEYLEYMKDKI